MLNKTLKATLIKIFQWIKSFNVHSCKIRIKLDIDSFKICDCFELILIPQK